ncbi:hypothetical protein CBM2587_A30001 [Cupriavidus taiwanensis]|uniref:Uncharacterized protein n=1 Tax=Cupriavidus taiwanensis TaxID=164546 RepID=A0A975X1T6_9BURK|nr:hypothetical protein CBM2587_A30001 [Cupriavidus taiwanensis]
MRAFGQQYWSVLRKTSGWFPGWKMGASLGLAAGRNPMPFVHPVMQNMHNVSANRLGTPSPFGRGLG